MTIEWLKDKLTKSFKNELPGWEAQKILSPGYNPAYRKAKPDAKKASVMALISNHKDKPHLIYIKRASHYAKDKHKGQISFPGGQIEKGETKYDAVIREVEEEVGIRLEQYEIIGELSSLYIFVSNFLVYPYVAFANEELNFNIDVKEVEKVIQWPLDMFLQGTKMKDISIRNATIKDVPYYPIGNEALWGATSMITSELLTMLSQD